MRLNTLIHRLFHAQKNRIRPEMTRIGLSPGQPKVLNYIAKHERCMQREIAEALDIEPATVSKILGNMVRAGLVERDPSAQRKRAETLTLTEEGQRRCEQWSIVCGAYEELALLGFSEADRACFEAYLCRAYQNITGKTLE